MGQFLEDLELADLERLAVTTFPYHQTRLTVTATVNSQPLCSESQVRCLFRCLLFALADLWSTVC